MEIKFYFFKDLRIRGKGNGSPGSPALSYFFDRPFGYAAYIVLAVLSAVAAHLGFERHGKRVDDRYADSVQTAGYFVRVTAEFASRVQGREYGLKRGFLGLFMDVYRNAASIVYHAYVVVGEQCDGNLFGMPCHCLVNGVVQHLPYQVVQAVGARGADIHARALAHGLKTLQDIDVFCGVRGAAFSGIFFTFFLFCHD